jgi:hypothetical protein
MYKSGRWMLDSLSRLVKIILDLTMKQLLLVCAATLVLPIAVNVAK